jgi:hypothetical protein
MSRVGEHNTVGASRKARAAARESASRGASKGWERRLSKPQARLQGSRVHHLRQACRGVRASMKPGKPILDACTDCGGTGQVQQHCENCLAPLTTSNWKLSQESYACDKCVALDSAP